MKKKNQILKELGVDYLIIQPFTKKFANLPYKYFLRELIFKKISPQLILVGDDHRFGKNREGNLEDFMKFAKDKKVEVSIIKSVGFDNEKISSTKIRGFLQKGNLEKVKEYLGRYFSVEGKIITGKKVGRTIGFPTANVKTKIPFYLPDGVYVTFILIDKILMESITYIGDRPTFLGENKQFEVHILDFCDFIYFKDVEVFFVEKVRDDEKFNDKNSLKKQIFIDIKYAKKVLEGVKVENYNWQ